MVCEGNKLYDILGRHKNAVLDIITKLNIVLLNQFRIPYPYPNTLT